jgi:putative acyl-CoA dehydrogenase
VLRALARDRETGAALLAELEAVRGREASFDAYAEKLRRDLLAGSADEFGARWLVERLALALQAAVLLGCASPAAALFVRSRLGGEQGLAFGTLSASDDADALIARALPL